MGKSEIFEHSMYLWRRQSTYNRNSQGWISHPVSVQCHCLYKSPLYFYSDEFDVSTVDTELYKRINSICTIHVFWISEWTTFTAHTWFLLFKFSLSLSYIFIGICYLFFLRASHFYIETFSSTGDIFFFALPLLSSSKKKSHIFVRDPICVYNSFLSLVDSPLCGVYNEKSIMDDAIGIHSFW